MALKHNLLPKICIFFNRQEYKCSFEFGYLFFTEAVQNRLQKLHTQKHNVTKETDIKRGASTRWSICGKPRKGHAQRNSKKLTSYPNIFISIKCHSLKSNGEDSFRVDCGKVVRNAAGRNLSISSRR